MGPNTVPTPGIATDPTTSVLVDLVISGQEMIQLLRTSNDLKFQFPKPIHVFRFPSGLDYDGTPETMNKVLEELAQQLELHVRVQLSRRVPTESDLWGIEDTYFLGYYQVEGQPQATRPFYSVLINQEGNPYVEGHPTNRGPLEDVRVWLASQLKSRIYRFRAERFNVGQSPFGDNSRMSTNAANLPEVLNLLNANRPKFDQFNREVRQILRKHTKSP